MLRSLARYCQIMQVIRGLNGFLMGSSTLGYECSYNIFQSQVVCSPVSVDHRLESPGLKRGMNRNMIFGDPGIVSWLKTMATLPFSFEYGIETEVHKTKVDALLNWLI